MADGINAGLKRSRSSLEDRPRKTRRVHHKLRHVQVRPQNVEPASQDPVFAEGQLLRSISATLAKVGFDSVKPTALEMFRAATEEYMLQFLQHVRTSMQASRRTQPTALDFAAALALVPNTSRASLLKPQLALSLPPAISHPDILPPDPDPEPPKDLSALLKPLMPTSTPAYIPRHFPWLPPFHAWKSSPDIAEREDDARKMREKATEEGLLAEHALRKLAAAAKAGAAKAEKRRATAVLAGVGRTRAAADPRSRRPRVDAEAMFAEALAQVGGQGDDAVELGLGADAATELRADGVDLDMPDGVVVDYGMAGWRHSGRRHLRL